jgi:Flp pilus assembly protein TadB
VAGSPPPISVRCECGAEQAVPYGERWTCPTCGRAWNTAQIPAEEYTRRNRQMNRFRIEILAFAVVLLVVFVPLVLFVSGSYLFLAIIVGLAWMFLYMPFWRRRVRRAAANAPRWELHAE